MKPSLPQEQKRKRIVWIYVCETEYQQIVNSSKKAGLTISNLGRRLLIGTEVKSRENHTDIINMLNAHAELNRIGGLLKLAISEGHSSNTVFSVLRKLEDARQSLHDKILAIRP